MTITSEQHSEIVAGIANGLHISSNQVSGTILLLENGNTVPFIARYRKEITGSLDEVQIRSIDEQYQNESRLIQEKDNILDKIRNQGKLTSELEKSICAANTMGELQEIYNPYKVKKKTRGQIARELGLSPLAELIKSQKSVDKNLKEIAFAYINKDKGLDSVETILAGARDIIAEDTSNNLDVRDLIKNKYFKTAQFTSKVSILHKMDIEEQPNSDQVLEGKKYEQYFEFEELAFKTPPHRLLAMIRGDREGILNFKVIFDDDAITRELKQNLIIQNSPLEIKTQLELVIEDCWKRLLGPSMGRELKRSQLEKAEQHSIQLYSENLKQLILTSPVKQRILGIDPAYRTGCKYAAISETGEVLETGTIYPHKPQVQWEESKAVLKKLILNHGINLICIGNGTASRETEMFITELAKNMKKEKKYDVSYVIISEAGASVYSASEIAREEFPNLDVSLRGAVSIARRLQDPLAELVKIDPKSHGIGQYQHDLPGLPRALKDVVMDAVNLVGVDLNTASKSLLSYVSGISNLTAANILEYRKENGAFIYRNELLKVKGIGERTYQQSAGFLRIPESPEPFDNSPIHPESYDLASKILSLSKFTKEDLVERESRMKLQNQIKLLNPEYAAKQLSKEDRLETIIDIINTLQNPYRDPREDFPKPLFKSEVLSIEDLTEGMEVEGTITNVVDFGCFVDIGVKTNGLVHVSEMSDSKFIKHPREAGLKIGDIIKAKIIEIDIQKNRISLTLRTKPKTERKKQQSAPKTVQKPKPKPLTVEDQKMQALFKNGKLKL